MYQPIILSLFSGAGGLDIGFEKAGFKIAACVEKEEIFCKTLELNLGRYSKSNCQVLHRDIRDLQPSEISLERVDFIIGGPPCQSFSAIGRRAGGIDGIQDERGSLFEHYCRLLKYYKPKGFLFENVRGILGANKGKDWQVITNAFENLGYKLYYRVLDCADYGVPQHRERLILVGIQHGKFKFPRPIYGSDSPNNHSHISALEAIVDLQDPSEPEHHYSGKYGKLLTEVPPGMNYHYFTKEMGYTNPIFAWRSRFSDFLYKADPHKPVRTIVAQLGAYSGPFHWKNRKFTLQEFKRLQTFPDDYEFAGSLNTILKQIGNSVPPNFAEKLAMAVLQQLFASDLCMDLLDEEDQLSFDARKAHRAKSTRVKRLKNTEYLQLNLLEDSEYFLVSKKEFLGNLIKYNDTILFNYLSPKSRIQITQLTLPQTGNIYKFSFERAEEICSIYVSHYQNGSFINTPLLQYQITFDHLIGDGLRKIICTLLSGSDKDIPIAWDAIEDCLSRSSGYKTMMDVYGHFTEPHPTFTLNLDIFNKTSSFLMQFIKEFSKFESTKKVLSEELLKNIYPSDKSFDLAKVVQELRELRFDVRVHETNQTIPPGYFRCCYPFTININKQISVKWKSKVQDSRAGFMTKKSNYTNILSQAFNQAQTMVNSINIDESIETYKQQNYSLNHPLKTKQDGNEIPLNKTIVEAIETIISNFNQNKYLYSILITSLVEKVVYPNQDIRYSQTELPGGYSNRSTDQIHVTPFLQLHGLTACAASGAESGRNFERPYPYTLDYLAKPRGKGNREAFLGILHAVQVDGVDPFPCIVLLMVLDLRMKQKVVYEYPQPQGLTIQQIFDAVIEHHQNATGNGRARLPVLAIQAVYKCLVTELARYQDKTLRNPPNRHTANDKDSWIGDVQIDRLDETPFEGVEVKSERPITTNMVSILPKKFAGYTVDRYYILSTSEPYINKEQTDEVMQIVEKVRQNTGCQIIINGLNQSLRYYLRLLSDPNQFLKNYTEQIETDLDVKDEHRKLWAKILENITH